MLSLTSGLVEAFGTLWEVLNLCGLFGTPFDFLVVLPELSATLAYLAKAEPRVLLASPSLWAKTLSRSD